MVKLSLLSPNLVLILTEILNNQKICKYLMYNDSNPLSNPDITNPYGMMLKYVFPTPFDPELQNDDTSSIRVFYLHGDLEKEYPVGENMKLLFDIVVAKVHWLINDGQPKIRPLEIMSELVNSMDNKVIGTVGKLHFLNFGYMAINNQFDGYRLVAEMNLFH